MTVCFEIALGLLSSSRWNLLAGHQTREWSGGEVRHRQRKDREWGGKVKEERGAQQKRREERRQQKRVKGRIRRATKRRSEGGSPSKLTGVPVALLITGMFDRMLLYYSDACSFRNHAPHQVAFVQASKRHHHHHGDRGAELKRLAVHFQSRNRFQAADPETEDDMGRSEREQLNCEGIRRVNMLPMKFVFPSPLPFRRVRIAREDIQVVLLAGEEKEENEET